MSQTEFKRGAYFSIAAGTALVDTAMAFTIHPLWSLLAAPMYVLAWFYWRGGE